MRSFALVLVLLLLSAQLVLAEYSLQAYCPGNLYKAICVANMAGDPVPEIVAANTSTHTVEIWTYDSQSGSMVLIETIPGIIADINHMAVGDLDHDGDQDVVLGLRFRGLWVCFRQAATWHIVQIDPTYSWQVFIEDFDRDGHPDIFDGTDWGYIKIFYGDGSGGFVQGAAPPSGHTYGAAVGFNAVDLNGDSYPDLLGPGYEWYPSQNYLRAYLNLAPSGVMGWSASIGPVQAFPDLGGCPHSSGDLDHNGHADLVCFFPTGQVCVFWGHEFTGSLYWVPELLDTCPGTPHLVAAYDANDDGNLDVMVGGGNEFTGLYIYYGDGAGGFCPAVFSLDHGFGFVRGFCVGDVNGDSWPDVVSSRCVAGTWDGFDVLYRLPVLAPAPRIFSIADVGNDQGRQVRLKWFRSIHDAPGEPIITGYAVYREQSAFSPRLLPGEEQDAPVPELGRRLDGWDYLLTVPARGDSIYQVIAPTLCDSTAGGGICWSTFFVSAMTPDPLVYFDSQPDSGYSVDNLAPAAPTNLHYESPTLLAWDESGDEDFDHFTVYGSANPVLDGSAVVLGHTTETHWQIRTGDPYFHVTATDFAGNEGPPATIANLAGAAVDGDGRGGWTSLELETGRPNPSCGTTQLSFRLPSPANVTLEVIDLTGRSVITLVDDDLAPGRHMISWDGLDRAGRMVPAGMYLCRLRAGDLLTTGRIARLR